MAYKYFFYSTEQLSFRTRMEAKIGKKFKPGNVFYKGKKIPFTEMLATNKATYSDAKLVAEGEELNLKFTLPEGV